MDMSQYHDLFISEVREHLKSISKLVLVLESEPKDRATIDEIAKVAEDNAAATEQVSAATEEQSAAMQEMAAASRELSLLSSELLKTVERFRLPEDLTGDDE